MEIGGLSLIGLLMATVTSVTNVVNDVTRKKALEGTDLIGALSCIKFFAALTYALVFLYHFSTGGVEPIHSNGSPLFGIKALAFLPPLTQFFIYLFLDMTLVAVANILYFRALQVSPMSLCLPFIAFTPIFLIPTGYVMLRELPSTVKLIGVVLVVAGSLVMHRQLFAVSWLEPFKAIVRERGSRYMLIVAAIFSVTNPLDAQLVRMSGAITQSFAYGITLSAMFIGLALARRSDWQNVMRTVPTWAVLAGVLEAIALIFQFTSHKYIAVVITISLKRAGIVLAVLMGWLVFKERDINDKLIAAAVMATGALMFYLPMQLGQSLTLAALVLLSMVVALYLTRHHNAGTPAENEAMVAGVE